MSGFGGFLATSNTANIPEYSPYYNVNTQFYVPSVDNTSLNLVLPTGSNTLPQILTYVRAR